MYRRTRPIIPPILRCGALLWLIATQAANERNVSAQSAYRPEAFE